MNDSCAVFRMARDTISCSSAEVSVHCADSSVMPLHWIGTDSKLSAGGGVSVGGFAMTFTAGALDAVEAGRLGDGAGLAWTPCSRHARESCRGKSTSMPPPGVVLCSLSGGGSMSKLAMPGEETDPPWELLGSGVFRPEPARLSGGAASSVGV